MRYSTFFALAAPLAAVHAAPVRRQSDNIDVTILKFADVLEQLESEFYAKALEKFQPADFTNAGFASPDIAIQQFQVIQSDEATHSTVLQAGLAAVGETPVTSCKFNFDSALTDVTTMAAIGRVVENVGVGAYLGAAPLVTDPVILQAAGSILTVEARHQTVQNLLSGGGTSVPAAFDIALAPSEVLAIAAPFFDGPCDLGVPAHPTLSLTNTGLVGPGTKLEFQSDAINGTVSEDDLFCQMLLGGQPTSIALPFKECVVPQINGPVAIFVTSDSQPLVANTRDRQTNNNKLVAGPTLAFIDTQPQMLGQMLRASGTTGGASSESTQTITPDQASKVIEGAQSTGAPSSTSGAEGSAPTSNGVNNGGKPNLNTGFSADGTINVIGWSGL
ncbi:hypothetical protein PQX77_014583 [Marasmius sp. AFHP31]|nr:hypothetical protein PQX77_014583 [Marasmius sp. AFHP31]